MFAFEYLRAFATDTLLEIRTPGIINKPFHVVSDIATFRIIGRHLLERFNSSALLFQHLLASLPFNFLLYIPLSHLRLRLRRHQVPLHHSFLLDKHGFFI